jgi:toxin FitB
LYLVDTNVISAGLVEWMDAHSTSSFLSAVTVAKIEDGIAKLRRESHAQKLGYR